MSSFVLLLLSTLALASFTPTAPGPGDSFAAGSSCTTKWIPDTPGGKWTDFAIFLMTGSNNNMTRLATVVSGLDGTDQSRSLYSWPCPEVDPYSPIYFYQFTNRADMQDSQWTTRFTITSASGSSEKPEYDKQPNGDPVPWGEGRLVSRVNQFPVSQQALSDATSQHDQSDADPDDDDSDGSSDDSDEPESGNDGAPTDADSQNGIHRHNVDASPNEPEPSSPPGLASASSRHLTGNPTGSVSQALFPTVNLPETMRPAHAQPASLSASAPNSSASCSQMGPGISITDNAVKLASAACTREDRRWQGAASLYWFLAAMLL
ncbi:hypothetical protein GSI_00829 [Ganoderma sinense ZZ0214-1]|uniref:Yeast cell wall synthesis Kre9/Knh1-like N-terminal domain-containing protein n=1 Tax=Ganoderma sinense ZZ0214-1 TaxID=1077348 RepID=A0A2G8STN8_9APHY|nr:hypothetical protein GSI_00829 [Ganoderma sinense ZZ0214-1]